MEYSNDFIGKMVFAYSSADLINLMNDNANLGSVYCNILDECYITPKTILAIANSEYKLALTHLSSITDEDAIRYAKQFDKSQIVAEATDFEIERMRDEIKINLYLHDKRIGVYSIGFHPSRRDEIQNKWLQAIGIDMGFSGFNNGEFTTIPSLIQSGLAIDATTLKQ